MSDLALQAIERLLVDGAVSPRLALKAAYSLGNFDGAFEMAKVAEPEKAACACGSELNDERGQRDGVCRKCL